MNRYSVHRRFKQKRRWLDLTWTMLSLISLVFISQEFRTGRLCSQMGVDFRGYYASAQIALQHGFAEVYDQEIQKVTQSALIYRCPEASDQPPLYVAMPYLPVFVLLFLPFTLFGFTTSYIIWLSLQLGIFFFYLRHTPKAFGERVSTFRILQWGICIPLISNLYLGQINALLVVLFAEFVIALSRGKKRVSGLWLSTLLIKPHTLILFLPGLLVSHNWSVLVGFAIGSVVIIGASYLLAGLQGLVSMIRLSFQFAGPLIQTASGMMNWRALALNLEDKIPAWNPWLIAGLGAAAILVVVLRRWRRCRFTSATQLVLLAVTTAFGTFIVSWHSHFYMLMLVVPLLLYLDTRKEITLYQLAAWLLGPPVIYAAAHLLVPALEHNLFGMGMLALNIWMLFSTLKRSWNYHGPVP